MNFEPQIIRISQLKCLLQTICIGEDEKRQRIKAEFPKNRNEIDQISEWHI